MLSQEISTTRKDLEHLGTIKHLVDRVAFIHTYLFLLCIEGFTMTLKAII